MTTKEDSTNAISSKSTRIGDAPSDHLPDACAPFPDDHATPQTLETHLLRMRTRLEIARAKSEIQRTAVQTKLDIRRIERELAVGKDSHQWLLYAGLAFFGAALGMTAGLSQTAGTAQGFLAALLTFLAGVFVAHSGIRKSATEGAPLGIVPATLGLALAALSFGILLGVFGGIRLRTHPPGWLVGKQNAAATHAPVGSASIDNLASPPQVRSPFGLQGDLDAEPICASVYRNLANRGQYETLAPKTLEPDGHALYNKYCKMHRFNECDLFDSHAKDPNRSDQVMAHDALKLYQVYCQ